MTNFFWAISILIICTNTFALDANVARLPIPTSSEIESASPPELSREELRQIANVFSFTKRFYSAFDKIILKFHELILKNEASSRSEAKALFKIFKKNIKIVKMKMIRKKK